MGKQEYQIINLLKQQQKEIQSLKYDISKLTYERYDVDDLILVDKNKLIVLLEYKGNYYHKKDLVNILDLEVDKRTFKKWVNDNNKLKLAKYEVNIVYCRGRVDGKYYITTKGDWISSNSLAKRSANSTKINVMIDGERETDIYRSGLVWNSFVDENWDISNNLYHSDGNMNNGDLANLFVPK